MHIIRHLREKKKQHLKVSFKNKIHDGLVHLDKNHNLYTF